MGARAQLLTGILLVGLVQANDEEVDNAKIGVKLVVAVAVVACAEIAAAGERKGRGRARSSSTPPALLPAQRARRRPVDHRQLRPVRG